MRTLLTILLVLATWPALAEFSLEDDGRALTVIEDGKPVLVYRYAFVEPPKRVPEHFRRSCYIHPLYGLDGEVLTQDFPVDHFHHRGVFWAWPKSTIGDKPIDVWALPDTRQVHEAWLTKKADAEGAVIGAQNVWVFDSAPEDAIVREKITFTVLPAEGNSRAIDFHLHFENLGTETLTIRGATTDNKGYGGLCLRPDATRRPFTFTAAQGELDGDKLHLESPWLDISYARKKGGKKISGAAFFQHPGNPGYPHPGWITRGYGFLGVSWPHTEAYELKPGQTVELRYRLLVHRGTAEGAKVKKAFQTYEKANVK